MTADDRSVTSSCPAGKDCPYLEEITELRHSVEQLAEQINTDPLTGLHNYRHFSESIEQEMERTRRSAQPLCLMVVDLDHFKRVNDNWGHEVGNQVLQNTAKLIRQALRRFDVPCRYGGEEFAILLPNTYLADGYSVAERLRCLIEECTLDIKGSPLQVTASVGVDVFTSSNKDSARDFIERTDKLLYAAKEAGRNQVQRGISEPIMRAAEVSQDEKDALFGFTDDEPD